LEKIGSSKTVAQVRATWKALKSGYSEKNRVNKISGSNRMSCDSEKELDEVLGTRPSIKPALLITAVDEHIINVIKNFIVFLILSNGPTWGSF